MTIDPCPVWSVMSGLIRKTYGLYLFTTDIVNFSQYCFTSLLCVSTSHQSMCSVVFEGLAQVHCLAASPAGMCVMCVYVESAAGFV